MGFSGSELLDSTVKLRLDELMASQGRFTSPIRAVFKERCGTMWPSDRQAQIGLETTASTIVGATHLTLRVP
jgi:hypothetical protein